MAIEWLSILKNIPELVTSLGSLVKNNRATKDTLIRELRLNLKAFKTASKSNAVNYDKLIELLNNEAIKAARKNRFAFNTVKTGKLAEEDIRDDRNLRYIDKDCDWLFKNIDEKIEDLRIQKNYHGSLNNIDNTNISLQFSNLFYKLKLLAEFIN